MSRYHSLLKSVKYYSQKESDFLKLLKDVEMKKNYDLMRGIEFRKQEIKNYYLQYKNGSKYMK
jgi:hypothetical protein